MRIGAGKDGIWDSLCDRYEQEYGRKDAAEAIRSMCNILGKFEDVIESGDDLESFLACKKTMFDDLYPDNIGQVDNMVAIFKSFWLYGYLL